MSGNQIHDTCSTVGTNSNFYLIVFSYITKKTLVVSFTRSEPEMYKRMSNEQTLTNTENVCVGMCNTSYNHTCFTLAAQTLHIWTWQLSGVSPSVQRVNASYLSAGAN